MDIQELNPRKIAIAGDWHGDFPYARKSLKKLHDKGVDTVLQLGDFGIWPNPKDGHVSMLSLQEELDRLDMHLLFIGGNHENWDWLDAQPVATDGTRKLAPRLWHLPNGLGWAWNLFGQDVKFVALGGAFSTDRKYRKIGWDLFLQETISDEELSAAVGHEKADVLLTHDAPSNAPVRRSSNFSRYDAMGLSFDDKLEDRENSRKVETAMRELEVKSLFHGHFHTRYADEIPLYPMGEKSVRIEGLDMNKRPFERNALVVEALEDLNL